MPMCDPFFKHSLNKRTSTKKLEDFGVQKKNNYFFQRETYFTFNQFFNESSMQQSSLLIQLFCDQGISFRACQVC